MPVDSASLAGDAVGGDSQRGTLETGQVVIILVSTTARRARHACW
jgi:hypothetical protein